MTKQDYRPPVTEGSHEADSFGAPYLPRRRTLVGLVSLLVSSVTVVRVGASSPPYPYHSMDFSFVTVFMK